MWYLPQPDASAGGAKATFGASLSELERQCFSMTSNTAAVQALLTRMRVAGNPVSSGGVGQERGRPVAKSTGSISRRSSQDTTTTTDGCGMDDEISLLARSHIVLVGESDEIPSPFSRKKSCSSFSSCHSSRLGGANEEPPEEHSEPSSDLSDLSFLVSAHHWSHPIAVTSREASLQRSQDNSAPCPTTGTREGRRQSLTVKRKDDERRQGEKQRRSYRPTNDTLDLVSKGDIESLYSFGPFLAGRSNLGRDGEEEEEEEKGEDRMRGDSERVHRRVIK